jgi:hypothetical protein
MKEDEVDHGENQDVEIARGLLGVLVSNSPPAVSSHELRGQLEIGGDIPRWDGR